MTILDDAKTGMDHSVRPQDDLFGHVNGAWLATAEIPSDRSSWGPFVSLTDQAEADVLAIIEDCAGGALVGNDATKIGALFASFMDESRIEELGATPVLPLLAQIDALSTISELGAFLGQFERRGGGGIFGSYIDTDDRNSDRYLMFVTQGGIGLPDETYYREEKYSEIRDKYVAYMEGMLALAGRDDVATTAQRVMDLETHLAKGHWERADTRDVIKTYNLVSRDELVALTPSFDWAGWMAALGGSEHTIAEVVVRQPSYLEHLEKVLAATPLQAWKDLLTVKALRLRRGLSVVGFRRDQLRLLWPHPGKHPRVAGALEARRRDGGRRAG
ncbi:MAG: M13 family metallopeptidase N-terminal domain-containing protein [Marmoricola sp.]